MFNNFNYGGGKYNSLKVTQVITPPVSPDTNFGTVEPLRIIRREFFPVIGQKLFPQLVSFPMIGEVLFPANNYITFKRQVAVAKTHKIQVLGKLHKVARFIFSVNGTGLKEGQRYVGIEGMKLIPIQTQYNFNKQYLTSRRFLTEIVGKKKIVDTQRIFVVGSKDTTRPSDLLLYLMAMGD